MGSPDGPAHLPISLSVELVGLDEDGASGLGGRDDDDISRNALLRVNFQHISNLYVLRLDGPELPTANEPVLRRVALLIALIPLEIVVCLLGQR